MQTQLVQTALLITTSFIQFHISTHTYMYIYKYIYHMALGIVYEHVFSLIWETIHIWAASSAFGPNVRLRAVQIQISKFDMIATLSTVVL